MTAQEVRAKGHDLRDKIRRGVTSVMKWSVRFPLCSPFLHLSARIGTDDIVCHVQNSCRTGKARWAYSTGVACEEVVLAAFRLEGDKTKTWKQKRSA
jgi:hypothetical protein